MTNIPDVKLSLYYGNAWHDFTQHMTAFQILDKGIQATPSAIINLTGSRSAFTDYLAAPYIPVQLQIKPDAAWLTPFVGKISNPHLKTIAGQISTKVKLSLDCVAAAQRLATDYITFDYYKLQSAVSPYTSDTWTYRRMIEDMLSHPDSSSDGTGLGNTGFTLTADTDESGIDHIIDASGTWSGQSILEAVRTICEHIGYDGYYDQTDVKLAPFNKDAIADLTDPFIGEPEWVGGDVNDLANVIFVHGGVDVGVPTDGDRWTEYGVTKYSPAIWTGEGNVGTVTPTDVDSDTVFSSALQVNSKCVKFVHTDYDGYTALTTSGILNIANTESLYVDALNRIQGITFNFKTFGGGEDGLASAKYVRIYLYDASGNSIVNLGAVGRAFPHPPASAADYIKEFTINLALGTEIIEGPPTFSYDNVWTYNSPSKTFDWEHVVSMKITTITHYHTYGPSGELGFAVEGLQFTGGLSIEPFQPYSATLLPPTKDAASIAAYGVHVLHAQDASITSFEQAQAEAARLLANLKDPHPTLSVTKPEPNIDGLLHPSDVVTVDSVDMRIAEMQYNWQSNVKRVDVSYKLRDKTAPLPPLWTQINELRYFVK